MLLLDEQGLKHLVDNINKDVNAKINSIQNRSSYIKEVSSWTNAENGLFKSIVPHPLNSTMVDVTAVNKTTGDRAFIHDRIIDKDYIEVISETSDPLVVLIVNGRSGVTEIDIPINDSSASAFETWSGKKIRQEIDNKQVDSNAADTTFDNSKNGMVATNVQSAIEENKQQISKVDTDVKQNKTSITNLQSWSQGVKNITISTQLPTDSQGSNGDIWIVYE